MTPLVRAQIRQQIENIRDACVAYDIGNWNEAGRIAKAARALFRGSDGSIALLPDTSESAKLRLLSTTAYTDPRDKNSNALGFIGMHPSREGFQAMFATTGRREPIPWERWWRDEIILGLPGKSNEVITRRQVVLASTGITGVMRPEDLAHLQNGFALSVEAVFRDGILRRVPLRFADLCILRQIGHELLASPELGILSRTETLIPPRILIEPEMNRFVREFGGTVVSDELGPGPELPLNADYAFRADNIVAELKCMSDDKTDDEGQQKVIQKLFDRYIERGLIKDTGPGQFIMESKNMPTSMQRELYQILGRAIHDRLKHANNQIKQTKKDLKMESANGLVLLANDGNYRLEPAQFAHAVDVALGNHFSAINTLVIFTVNLLTTAPGLSRHAMVWIPGGRNGHAQIPQEFMNRLTVGWHRHLSGLLNEEVPLLTQLQTMDLESLRYDQNLSRARK